MGVGHCCGASAQLSQWTCLCGVPDVCLEVAGYTAAMFELARQVMRSGLDLRANLLNIYSANGYLIFELFDDAALSSAVGGD